jgi:hypothetical protein
MQIDDSKRSLAGPTARRVVVGLALAALASLALIAAGCGGSSTQGVAQVDSTETTTADTTSEQDSADGSSSDDPAAYSACMRKNGVPKFPDPDSEGRLMLKAGPGTGIDPESPQFKAAAEACQKLAPKPPSPAQIAKDREQLLKFAACMRSHGLPKFPDPTSNGGLRIEKKSGIAPNSPQFKQAQQACKEFLPGGGGSSTERGPQ